MCTLILSSLNFIEIIKIDWSPYPQSKATLSNLGFSIPHQCHQVAKYTLLREGSKGSGSLI